MKHVPRNGKIMTRQRGDALPSIIAVVVILIIVALAAWFLIFKPRSEQAPPPPPPPTASAAAEAASAPPPPENVDALTADELIDKAQKAYNDGRLISPEGNNAFVFYLKALEKDPQNAVASGALRETFSFAASAVERDINANAFDEAQREIALLAEADPTNYTLTILRAKLDAQQKLAARAEEQAKQVEQQAEAQAEATRLAAQQAAEQARLEAEAAAAASAAAAAAQPAPRTTTQPTAEPEPEPPPPPEPAGPTRGPQIVKTVQPQYPPRAFRQRIQGWVKVEFTVDVNGDVIEAHAVESNRGHVFDRAAVEAIKRWKFKPALENGKPVEATLTQPINFSL